MSKRHIVWFAEGLVDGNRLPAAAPEPQARHPGGGWRTLHELAVAIAATGREVELRGRVSLDELEVLSAAAGARPKLPSQPTVLEAGDVLIMPEGCADPLLFGHARASAARTVVLAMAPPGLFGWPFVPGEGVGRPEQLRAIVGLGFELWTHMPELARRAEEAGVACRWLGNGRPGGYPEPSAKRWDVVAVEINRWAEDAQRVLDALPAHVSRHVIPRATNAEVLEQLGAARMLVYPMRVEGHSRIGQEARAMGAVPVVLPANPYAVGMDEQGGCLVVDSAEDMAAAVVELLGDAPSLAELRRRGMATAREQVDWDAYVARVDAAL